MFTRLLCVSLLVAGSFAAAADLPVQYTVDDKVLKGAVAGTNLTFQLYGDAACSGSVVHSQSVAVESVNVVSRLKRFRAPGSPTPPPKTAELSQTLTGVTASGNLFLKVTGTGVTPVGGACQAQAATVQAPAGLGTVVKSANGTVVGVPLTHASGDLDVLLRVTTRPTILTVGADTPPTGTYTHTGAFGYSSNDCTGPAFVNAAYGSGLFGRAVFNAQNQTFAIPGPTIAFTVGTSLQVSPTITSTADCDAIPHLFIAPHGCCYGGNYTGGFGSGQGSPVVESIDGSDFVEPLSVVVQ
jgi:hypothetical protein